MTKDVQKSAGFYQRFFGFEPVFDAGWYISLKHSKGQELAFIDASHESVPPEYQHQAAGFILNIEVDNVDDVYEKFVGEKWGILVPLETNEYGQHHFIISDPNNILVDIITMVEGS
ncbi:MAG: VOC family protein [Bacteroidales bacterium]|nr:VOC family protein [Bacteroidales bacterium]